MSYGFVSVSAAKAFFGGLNRRKKLNAVFWVGSDFLIFAIIVFGFVAMVVVLRCGTFLCFGFEGRVRNEWRRFVGLLWLLKFFVCEGEMRREIVWTRLDEARFICASAFDFWRSNWTQVAKVVWHSCVQVYHPLHLAHQITNMGIVIILVFLKIHECRLALTI